MGTINALDFAVNIDNLRVTQLVQNTYSDELAENKVLLRIDKFSFTSNNITYGIVGKRMNYWKFFPTQTGMGIIPAWGFATVIVTSHPEIKIGERFYGYYPMSSHLLVTANNVNSKGFVDNAEHRQALPPIYNFYTSADSDLSSGESKEELICIFRPLFVTSFLIEDHLVEQNYFGATCLLITGASSKTAQALAYLLAQRKNENGSNFRVLGLTSEKNVEFVSKLGWYDRTLSYDKISFLDATEKFVVVDFTGNHDIQFQLQTVLKDNLIYNCLVGLVDWQNLEGEKPLPHRGTFFFAPEYAEKRQSAWGLKAFHQKIEAAWQQFIEAIQAVLLIDRSIGHEKIEQLHLDMLDGKIDPKRGNIVNLNR